ncbi:hypothetical protein VNI00_003633 [Paramarasmius palmivorus]|uniref:Uncharacterized protein n=1 Tax=Paramarasmius palmivorus TaxID=297713 RepID=A0AAW0DTN7_9AGAR
MLAEMFSNASQFTISGNPTFNNVSGDQVNHQTINAEIVHLNTGSQGTMRSEYEEASARIRPMISPSLISWMQYEYIKQGNILFLKKVHSEEVQEWELRDGALVGRDVEARRNIYTVELNGSTPKFTAMTYEGKNAHTVSSMIAMGSFRSEHDNERYGRKIFGPSRVTKLVPLANFYNDRSFWVSTYIRYLAVSGNFADHTRKSDISATGEHEMFCYQNLDGHKQRTALQGA